jgi:protein ImuA
LAWGINRTNSEQKWFAAPLLMNSMMIAMARTTACTIREACLPTGPSGLLLERLRQKLSSVERATGLIGECGAPLDLGIAAIDAALGGGLACGALHEIAAVRESETPAATGFALAVTARFARNARQSLDQRSNLRGSRASAVLWVAEDLSLCENGVLYGPGLDAAGIAPEQMITVAATHARDVLWAMEEALRCRAVGVAIGEIRARSIDQVATRRLALAAAAGDTLGLLLRTAPDDAPSAVATRWIIGAASPSVLPSPERRHGIGPPRLAVRLVRNRRGHLGAWIVEWNSVEQRFERAAHSELMAEAAFDRPHRTAAA